MLTEDREYIPAADLPAIVWQADSATLTFHSVCGAAEQISGYPVSHWVETLHFFSERIHPEDRSATLAAYRTAIAQNGDASAEYRAITPSGVVWVRETIRVSGATITGVAIVIDRRRQLEEQLKRSERNCALHQLASRLARDLRNPLTILAGYGEDLLNTVPSGDPLRTDLEQMLAAGEQISGIAGRLLGFAEHHASPPGVVNIPRAIARLEDRIARAAGEGVIVEVESSVPILAFADERQFEEVVLALVSGRDDARVRTKLAISCEIDTIAEQMPGATLAPGRYARVSIRDDGRGCGAQNCMSVFESVLSSKDPESGAGLALARAYTVVRQWGGDIAFFSEPFNGSTFIVYLSYCPTVEL